MLDGCGVPSIVRFKYGTRPKGAIRRDARLCRKLTGKAARARQGLRWKPVSAYRVFTRGTAAGASLVHKVALVAHAGGKHYGVSAVGAEHSAQHLRICTHI